MKWAKVIVDWFLYDVEIGPKNAFDYKIPVEIFIAYTYLKICIRSYDLSNCIVPLLGNNCIVPRIVPFTMSSIFIISKCQITG